MNLFRIITLILAGYLYVFCPSILYSQTPKGFETKYVMGGGESLLLEDAEWFMGSYDYIRALPVYVKLDIRYPGVIEYKYYAGICYLHKYDEQEKAIPYFVRAYNKKPELPDLLYHLGVAYFVNYQFDKAIDFFKQASESKTVSGKLKETIPRLIKNCKNAKELVAHSNEKYVTIENLGAPLNTEYSEYVPLVSYDESVMIFTYKGKRSKGGMHNMYGEPDPEGEYYEDIFVSYKMGDKWLDPDDIGYRLNSSWHDAAMALSPDGQRLFVYKDTKGGDLYVSTLSRKTWSEPIRLEGEINTKHWEGHASLSVDGKTIYFSSDRPGGLGGKDLYKAEHIGGNAWGNIKNLGPKFNTEYDEDAPFIHANGEMLFFSSQGHNSMGGYDIFQSRQVNGKWQKAVNLGHPVNTPNDDLYYVVNPSGDKAYFSSTRKGTLGDNDIFVVKPGILTERPVLALIQGTIKYADRNAEATINVTDQTDGESYGSYKSNAASGNFIVPLPPGNEYKLEFLYKGKIVHTELIEVTTLDVYINVDIDLELSKKNSKINSTDIIQKALDKLLPQAKLDQEAWAKAEENRKADIGIEDIAVEETAAVETAVEEPTTEEAPVEEATVEETTTEEAPAEDPSVDGEETAAIEIPTEEPTTEEAPAEESTVEETATEEAPVEDPSVDGEETAAVETAAEEPTTEEAPVEDPSVDEEETAAVEIPTEEPTTEEAPAEESTVEETTTEEAPVEDPSVDGEETAAVETAVEEPTTEEAPVEESTVEETATEETPDVDPSANGEEPVVEETATAEEPAAEEIPIEETPAKEPAAEETTTAEATKEEPLVEETTIEEAPAEEPVVEETVTREALVKEPVVEETVTAEATITEESATVEETIAAETQTEKQPVKKAPVEETVAEETPAEKPAVAERIAEETIVEERVTEPAPAEEPAVAEPVEEKPVVEKRATETPVDIEMKVDNVLFGFDMSTIPPESIKELDRLVTALKNNRSLKIEIYGHTDHIGPDSYNQKLSLRRANSVANYLNAKGISKVRMIINGLGESKPIAPNIHPDGSDNPNGRKKNRRTEIRVVQDRPA